ncbi:MAG: lipase [Frankiales bacterium]|nr:lipase [Frankiales bacterium]
MSQPRALVAVVAALLALTTSAHADPGKPARTRPQGPAAVRFARDVPLLKDSEWGWTVGGFGGIRRGYPLKHVPVIFVHGNNVDAADWYPVRDDFLKAGWTRQELWGLSYGGLGGHNGTALRRQNPEADTEHQQEGSDQTYVTEDDVNVPDLYCFIKVVQAYTGSRRFVIVSHSLGVTLARETLRVHRELRRDLVAFVGIAGANHGTTFCPPGSEGNVVSCDEIAAGTAWLARLNAAGETYGPARWMTVYDGSGAGDPAYVGDSYAQSPALRGAVNMQYPHTYHNDLRVDAGIVAAYRAWIERFATLHR